MSAKPNYIVSIKPAPDHNGPLLVSNDQELVRIVIEHIRRTYTVTNLTVRPITTRPDPA